MAENPRPTGLYIHLPFCRSRCSYCTFTSTTELGLLPRTVAAICRELATAARHARRPLASVYFGGGTPSLLDETQMLALAGEIQRAFRLLPGAEITLEANPDDATPARLALWRSAGINRISLGVQSFSDAVLRLLDRRHDAAAALAAAQAVKDAGFALSLDLMLGLPGLGRRELEDTLARTLALGPQHVSAYLLEMDKPHRLGALAQRRADLFPDPDAAARQYLAVGRTLVAAGYRHYEVSSFALPGHQARHNLRYWLGLPVLAGGVAAHGQSGRQRWANTSGLATYLAAIEEGATAREWSRRLSPPEALKESVMLGLRLARGMHEETLERCGDIAPGLRDRLADFFALGLARRRGRWIRLTPRGWLVSNELLATL
ncbi:MAG: radical SAM family heme chaperone HemW [Acidobacteriota bacterium]